MTGQHNIMVRQTGENMLVEQELIVRYQQLLKLDKPNLYSKSKIEWVREILIKINQLKTIISRNNK